MAEIVATLGVQTDYKDRRYQGTHEEWEHEMATSSTLYVGNLAFFTTEEQIYQLFSKCGEVKRIIMGLDKFKKTPCGFCFCEYYHRKDAIDCVKFISGTKLDDRTIRADIDPGFRPGRQYGRGRHGGQVRDEHREDYDAGRGGWNAADRERSERMRNEQQAETYGSLRDVPDGAQSDFYSVSGAGEVPGKSKRGRLEDSDGEGEEDSMGRYRKR